MELRAPTIPELNRERDLGRDARRPGRWWRSGGYLADDRQHHRPGSPLRRRLKKGTQSLALGGAPRFRRRSRWNKGGGRSLGDFSTKIHLRANAEGLPIGIILSPDEAHDSTAYADLMEERESDPGILPADRGYDSVATQQDARDRGTIPEIPTKRNRRVQHSVDRPLYVLRNRIERCFNKRKNSRRIATRYDRTASSFLGFTILASIRLWIRVVHAS